MCYQFVHKDCISLNSSVRSQGMPESKLHVIFVALIVSRICYALSACGGFLNSQEINRISAFFCKARWFGLCSPTSQCDISVYLRMADSKLFHHIQSQSHCGHCLSHIYFHQQSISLDYILEDILMPFRYAQTTCVNAALFPDVNFVFFVISGYSVLLNMCVCHLFINKARVKLVAQSCI